MFWSKKVEKKFSKKSYRMEVQDITNNNKVVYTCHGDFCDSSEAWDEIKSRFLKITNLPEPKVRRLVFIFTVTTLWMDLKSSRSDLPTRIPKTPWQRMSWGFSLSIFLAVWMEPWAVSYRHVCRSGS